MSPDDAKPQPEATTSEAATSAPSSAETTAPAATAPSEATAPSDATTSEATGWGVAEQLPVEWFAAIRQSKKPECRGTLADLLAGVRDGAWRELVERARAAAPGEYDRLKKSARAAMACGTLAAGCERNARHWLANGVLLYDIDDLPPEAVREAKEAARTVPGFLAAFATLSGAGLRVFLLSHALVERGGRATPRDYKRAWEAGRDALRAAVASVLAKHGGKLDESTKDPVRLCAISYDPELIFAPDAQPATWDAGDATASLDDGENDAAAERELQRIADEDCKRAVAELSRGQRRQYRRKRPEGELPGEDRERFRAYAADRWPPNGIPPSGARNAAAYQMGAIACRCGASTDAIAWEWARELLEPSGVIAEDGEESVRGAVRRGWEAAHAAGEFAQDARAAATVAREQGLAAVREKRRAFADKREQFLALEPSELLALVRERVEHDDDAARLFALLAAATDDDGECFKRSHVSSALLAELLSYFREVWPLRWQRVGNFAQWQRADGAWAELDDTTLAALRGEIERLLRVPVQHDALSDAVRSFATRVAVDSFAEFAQRLPAWDGRRRLDEFARKLGAREPHEIKGVRAWFVGLARRAEHPGCEAQHALVLIGEGGTRKSTVAKVLGWRAPREALDAARALDAAAAADYEERVRWLEQHGVALAECLRVDPEEKDFYVRLNKHLLIEDAEMSRWSEKRLNAFKAMITQTTDRVRRPYGRADTVFQRRPVFLCTSNSGELFIGDSGERRWLPLRVTEPIDTGWIVCHTGQLWAEALAAARAGEPAALQGEALAAWAAARQDFAVRTWWDDVLDGVQSGRYNLRADIPSVECLLPHGATLAEVLQTYRDAGLHIPPQQERLQTLAAALRRRGWAQRRPRDDGRARRWTPSGAAEAAEATAEPSTKPSATTTTAPASAPRIVALPNYLSEREQDDIAAMNAVFDD